MAILLWAGAPAPNEQPSCRLAGIGEWTTIEIICRRIRAPCIHNNGGQLATVSQELNLHSLATIRFQSANLLARKIRAKDKLRHRYRTWPAFSRPERSQRLSEGRAAKRQRQVSDLRIHDSQRRSGRPCQQSGAIRNCEYTASRLYLRSSGLQIDNEAFVFIGKTNCERISVRRGDDEWPGGGSACA